MQPQSITPRDGVIILSGYGLRVAVEHGQLIVSDGRGTDRRSGRCSRARPPRRLVILGHTGSISLDAVRWLADVGCAVCQLDADGRVLLASAPPGRDDAKLRRAQATAPLTGATLPIARQVIAAKLAGQAANLDQLGTPIGAAAAAHIRALADQLPTVTTVEGIILYEADAARDYWTAWTGLRVRWATKATATVPDHWHAFASRATPPNGSNRHASDPINALLNYAYAVLETECRIALLAVGLDPALGVLHADRPGRDSLALDMLEVLRPGADAWVLAALQQRTFARTDFIETPDGRCRLLAPLARDIAATVPYWTTRATPLAATLAARFIEAASPLTPPTHRSLSPRTYGPLLPPPTPALAPPQLPPACQACGMILPDHDRAYCDACLPERRQEQATEWAAASRAKLAVRRATGTDPAHGGTAGIRRGRANAAHVARGHDWQRGHDSPPDARFTTDILPGLHAVPLQTMAAATGLTRGYCSFIRRGLRVPHPRHWATLATLTMEVTP